MLSSLFRVVFMLVIVVAVVVGIGAFFLGQRSSGDRTGEPPAVGTSGGDSSAPTARERGAEIGGRLGEAAGQVGEVFSDATLSAKIKSKMALDDLVKARDINVSTKDHVVTLSGNVASAPERDRAVQLARETDGVKSVNDKLRIGK